MMSFMGKPGPVWRAAAPTLLVREDPATKAVVSSRIAGFDLNDTLVTSKVGAPGYQVTIADWQHYNAQVPLKLRELHSQGFKLVIFTNQGNIRTAVEGKRAQAVKTYIDAFVKDVGVPIRVLAATQKDQFRKPLPGMWEHVEQKCNGGVKVDRAASFYVGDAAGGPGEHSADDSDFASALGVRFVHVRDYFGEPGGRGGGSAAAAGHLQATAAGGSLATTKERGVDWILETTEPRWRPSPPIVLVLTGAPGCGKTTFGEQLGPPAQAGPRASAKASGGEDRDPAALSKPWRRVCQDLLGNKDACERAAARCLAEGLSVVIDRTNVSVEQRATWLQLAIQNGATSHCLAFDVSPDECCRRVAGREAHEGGLQGGGPQSRMVVFRMHGLLEPVGEQEPFTRVRLVRVREDLDRELQRYSGRRSAANGAAKIVRAELATEPPSKKTRTSVSLDISEDDGAGADAAPQKVVTRVVCAPMDISEDDGGAGAGAGKALAAGVAPRRTTLDISNEEAADPGAAGGDQAQVGILVAMGFPEQACKEALAAAGGDANNAAERLLADRFSGD